MSIADVEAIYPESKFVSGLDFVGKYRNDLNLLTQARDRIQKKIEDDEIDDEQINEKLDRLNKSIDQLEKLINDFEQKHGLSKA